MEHENKRPLALVTGGSRGIGAAICKRLAKEGFDLIINSISQEELDLPVSRETIEACEAAGAKVVAKPWDVSDYGACEQAVEEITAEHGPVAVLVNNAGITKDGLLLRMKPEQFSAGLNVNLYSAFYMSKLCAKGMTRARRGKIVNISSVAGVYGNAGQANYASSKAGLIGLTKTISKELGSRNITCNAVAPGFIETAMTQTLPEKVVEGAKASISLGRFGTVEDIAGAVAFLCSPSADYITGQVLIVDGGLAM